MQGPDDDIPDYNYDTTIGLISAVAVIVTLFLAILLLTQCS